MPVIKGMPSFPSTSLGLIDADPYGSDGNLRFGATNVFFRQIRNLIFDTTAISHIAYGLHWPSSQATSLQNCVFRLSADPADMHTGVFIEQGSGGFIGDLVFYGGQYGAQFGNQQYTTRNLTFYGAETAILQLWDWGWTYKSISVNDCQVGINMTASSTGSVTLLDSSFTNVGTAILSARDPATQPNPGQGSLVMENVAYTNATTLLQGVDGAIIPGGTGVQGSFVFVRSENDPAITMKMYLTRRASQGNVYVPTGPTAVETDDPSSFPRWPPLLSGNKYYERSKVRTVTPPALSPCPFLDLGQFSCGA